MTQDRDTVIRQWMQAKDAAAQWSAEERRLRDLLALNLFNFTPATHNAVNDGTKRVDLGGGYFLKAVLQTDYKLTQGAALAAVLEDVRTLPSPLPKPLVSWSPKLSVSSYKLLPQTLRDKLAMDLTTKAKAPTLEIEHPKA